MRTTFDTIWRDLSPFTIGFDRTFDTLSLLAKNQAQNVNYPPYNIRKLSDNKYSIELALAGFEEKDIDIEQIEHVMKVNFFGTLNCIKAVEQYFKDKKNSKYLRQSSSNYQTSPNVKRSK